MINLFKFNPYPGQSPTILWGGEFVNDTSSIMWTERYRDAGEFEIVAPLSSGLRTFLPIGTLIGHFDTMEVMVVENHNIKEGPDEDPILYITGRSLETILENRIVGANQIAAGSSTVSDLVLASDDTYEQAKKLVNDHIQTPTDANDTFQEVVAHHLLTDVATQEERVFGRVPLYSAFMDILAVDNYGVRTIRRNTFTGYGGNNVWTHFMIHKGINREDSVIFSWKSGEIDGAEYLWSDKPYKNAAIVVGRYVNESVFTGKHGYERRMLVVPADDIDGHLDSGPTGAALTTIRNKMAARGRQALANQNRIALIRADASEVTRYQYRRDYDIGDIVSVDGNYGELAPMRVVEHTEIQDENEYRSYPTFSTPDPEG